MKSDEAYSMAKSDHDAITKFEVLIPRLERAVERMEAHSRSPAAPQDDDKPRAAK